MRAVPKFLQNKSQKCRRKGGCSAGQQMYCPQRTPRPICNMFFKERNSVSEILVTEFIHITVFIEKYKSICSTIYTWGVLVLCFNIHNQSFNITYNLLIKPFLNVLSFEFSQMFSTFCFNLAYQQLSRRSSSSRV